MKKLSLLSLMITFIDVWHPVFKVNNRRQDKYAIVPAQEIMLNIIVSKEKAELHSREILCKSSLIVCTRIAVEC